MVKIYDSKGLSEYPSEGVNPRQVDVNAVGYSYFPGLTQPIGGAVAHPVNSMSMQANNAFMVPALFPVGKYVEAISVRVGVADAGRTFTGFLSRIDPGTGRPTDVFAQTDGVGGDLGSTGMQDADLVTPWKSDGSLIFVGIWCNATAALRLEGPDPDQVPNYPLLGVNGALDVSAAVVSAFAGTYAVGELPDWTGAPLWLITGEAPYIFGKAPY